MTRRPRLAIDGGPRAFARAAGRPQPKIGVAEFLALAERFGFTPAALARIRAVISDSDLRGNGPNLARYACPFPDDVPPRGVQLEELACRKLGVRHALAVSSGTAALHAAFVAAGVGPGTEVICPGLGFMATAMAVMMAGGVPVFCDVDESLQLDPARIEGCITPRTVALALRAEGIPAGHRGEDHRPDWHVSECMFPVILQRGHIPGGSVFEDPRWLQRGGKVEYRRACPLARDLYAREVAVHVDQWWSERDCHRVAAGINKVLDACCTEDPSAKAWV
ncbi:MAG: DegT/DnrJ/EryC1/StrS family aminotransferase [Candidatus Latescibacterota bacterium]